MEEKREKTELKVGVTDRRGSGAKRNERGAGVNHDSLKSIWISL